MEYVLYIPKLTLHPLCSLRSFENRIIKGGCVFFNIMGATGQIDEIGISSISTDSVISPPPEANLVDEDSD